MKKCSCCGQIKNIVEFALDKTRIDGREYKCKECKRKKYAEYRERNPREKCASFSKKRCEVDGCERPHLARGLCGLHYDRWRRHGRTYTVNRERGTGTVMKRGQVAVKVDGRMTYAHVLVVERVLGKRLPKGAVVHHVNHNPSDNRPSNLVVCPSNGYHSLIHQREIALAACGNANYRKCERCGQHDDTATFRPDGRRHIADCTAVQ